MNFIIKRWIAYSMILIESSVHLRTTEWLWGHFCRSDSPTYPLINLYEDSDNYHVEARLREVIRASSIQALSATY